MDKTDIQILKVLQEDGRISLSDLADEVGLSKTPCWNRVKHLEDTGVIKGYGAWVDEQKLDMQIRAMIHVVIDFSMSSAFEKAAVDHSSVIRCAAVTGDFDYILEVSAKDMLEFDALLRADLSRLPGVQRFSTSISTREVKARK
ncbi:Lrp/AsnC family transcriptional regulator [Ningiella sp. W23]|uniref:Lrp/AsnC family transcriptional regulator n=1 Tax=Ningiella sp. W23 TaxID=3023715 RepID=UPI00375695B9